MIDIDLIDRLAARLGEALPPGATQAREEIEARFRAVLKRAFARMDLVTREEFEIQKGALERATVKLAALERQLEELEGQ